MGCGGIQPRLIGIFTAQHSTDYKLFSRINTFESILSRSAAEIMGNWHTGNLSNSELKTNIFVSDGDSPTARLKTVKTNTNLSINVSR